ncbi:hypothetical protein PsYK624_108450 [Phanerochaete sordida]|uniref:Uncharacterized protein n=1 Tax=Phanerochaete sordida TaxID=48140 RepID=A0A9P3LHH5_9APHY|nr:hypothetical protein PsYK624_108450 [Phanerochaete sordida]
MPPERYATASSSVATARPRSGASREIRPTPTIPDLAALRADRRGIVLCPYRRTTRPVSAPATTNLRTGRRFE